jgi:hypothetical protein
MQIWLGSDVVTSLVKAGARYLLKLTELSSGNEAAIM